MTLVDPTSLATTVDRIHDAHFQGRTIPVAQRREVARWLAGRQGLPGGYRGLLAMTEEDWSRDLRLFTGEKVTTRAGRSHVLGEEAARALRLLGVVTKAVRAALEAGEDGMLPHLEQTEAWCREHVGRPTGQFCCAVCSVALWRHLAAGGFEGRLDREAWLAAGMETLSEHRDGKRGWGRYPFHYAALLLSELDAPGADEERRYAAPRLERIARRRPKEEDAVAARRQEVARRVLARC
jgi:hypothetical protein